MTPREAYSLDEIAAVVLAGGQGTRLMPLTEKRCKPSVSFGGRYRLIDIPLSNSLNSGITNLFVISQFYATHLQEHILATYQLDLFREGKIELLCPQETPQGKLWFKGTADAIRQNLEGLLRKPFQYFLILAGDQLYNMHFGDMIHFARQENADLVIASLPVEENEARRMGLLKIDEKKNVLDFCEKPNDSNVLQSFEFSAAGSKKWLGSMGIYIFKRAALEKLLQCEGHDFGHDLIPQQLKVGKTKTYLYHGYWEDIGTITSFYKANLLLLKGREGLDLYNEKNPIYTRPHHLPSPWMQDVKIEDSLISQGSIIEAKEISQSIIGVRSHIQKGTIVRSSLILGSPNPFDPLSPIGNNCLIEKAIIDEGASIGNGVILNNSKNLKHHDGEGVYIRDGIIIVTSGAKIPDGFIL